MSLHFVMLGFGITNVGMLWWLAAAAAPLVIHLLNRRKYREVPWAAIEHLLAALKRSSRRIWFEQWLLLAIRTAAIVAVVLAVVGPYVAEVGGRFAVGEPVHRVLVLDGSYSMDVKSGERTRFEIAKDVARDLVARSSQGDGFTLVLMSAPARTVVGTPAFVSDEVRSALKRLRSAQRADLAAAEHIVAEDDFLKELRELRLPQGGGDLAEALDRVDDVIARAKREYPRLASTEVYFLTDLGRTTWGPAAANAGGALRDRLLRLGHSARLALADLGQDNIENLAITSFRANQSVLTTRSPVEFQADVRNFGAKPHQARAELWVDGRRMQQQPLEIAPRANQTVVFSQRLETTGDHALEARLVGDPQDPLDVDNHRWLVAPVKDSLSALIVNGEGSLENTRYLYDALDPYRDGSGPLPVRVERISDGSLLEQDLRRFDAVFLSNVAEFTAAETRSLAEYARGGGGLVFFLGDQVDPARYNQELGGGLPNSPRLLPALLDAPIAVGHYGFDPLDYADPLLREFRGNERAGLLSTTITRYFRLRVPKPPVLPLGSSPGASPTITAQSTVEPPAARVALAIRQSGDPAIVVSAGPNSGRSIVVALPASFASVDPATKEPWSNWPLKASFPPIVQNLLLTAIGPQGVDRNTLVGRPLESMLLSAGASAALVLETPEGRKEQIRVAARDVSNRWSFADTWQSGIYRARFSSAADSERLFGLNVDTAESDLTRIEADQLPEGLNVTKALAGAADPDRPAADLEVRSGYERVLLYTALALLLTECVLAWWFGHRAS